MKSPASRITCLGWPWIIVAIVGCGSAKEQASSKTSTSTAATSPQPQPTAQRQSAAQPTPTVNRVPVVTRPQPNASSSEVARTASPLPSLPLAGRAAMLTPAVDLSTHAADLTDVAISPDGRFVAAVDGEMNLKISATSDGALKHEFKLDFVDITRHPTITLAFAPQKPWLAAGAEGKLQLYDCETGKVLGKIADKNHNDFRDLQFNSAGDRLVGVGLDRVDVWSVPDGAQVTTFKITSRLAKDVVITRDGRTLVCGGDNNTLSLYDLQTGTLQKSLTGPKGSVGNLSLNADESLLVAVDVDHHAAVFDWKSQQLLYVHDDFQLGSALMFSPEGWLVNGAYVIEVYEVGRNKLRRVAEVDHRGQSAADGLGFSRDGRLMVSCGSRSRRPDLFVIETSLEERTLVDGREHLRGVAVSDDGRFVAWNEVESLKLYSTAENREVASASIDKEAGYDRKLIFSPDGLLLALHQEVFFKGKLSTFTVPDLKLRKQWSEERQPNDIRFTPDGKSLLLFGYGASRAIGLEAKDQSTEVAGLTAEVARFARDAVGELLFTVDGNELRASRWPSPVPIMKQHTGHDVGGLAVSSDASVLATFHEDDTRVLVWNGKTGEPITELIADKQGVPAAAFSADGSALLTGGRDGRLKIWSRDTWKLRASVPAHAADVAQIIPVAGGGLFYTRGRDKNISGIKQWDLAKLLQRVPTPPEAPRGAEPLPTGGPFVYEFTSYVDDGGFTDGGRSVYCREYTGQLKFYDLAGGAELRSLDLGKLLQAAASPNGRHVASLHGIDLGSATPDLTVPSEVRLWDPTTREVRHVLPLEFGAARSMSFSADSRLLAIAGGRDDLAADGAVSIWEVDSGRRSQSIRVPGGRPEFVQLSPDGSLVVFGGYDEHVSVFDLKAGRLCFRKPLNAQLNDAQFSPDGRWVAVGTRQNHTSGKFFVLGTADGSPHPTFPENVGLTASVAFSPVGNVLAAAYTGDGGELMNCFFSWPDGREIRRLTSDKGDVINGRMRFSPDGAWLAGDSGGDLRVWRVDHLFDLALQRDLERLQQRKAEVEYKQGTLGIGFDYDQVNARTLADLPVLTKPFTLDISGGKLTDADLAPLAKQSNLIGLDLSMCDSLTAASLERIKHLPLRSLNVRADRFSDTPTIAAVGAFTQLEDLQIWSDYSGNDPAVFAPLGKLVKLRSLQISFAEPPPGSLAPLANCSELESWTLRGKNIRDEEFASLKPLTKLRKLELDIADGYNGAGLAHLAASTNLETLKFDHCYKMKDDGAASVRLFSKLRDLDLSNHYISERGLAAVTGLTELEHIKLPRNVNDAGMAHLANLRKLRELDLAEQAVTDAGLRHLANLTELESLSLRETKGVTGSGLVALAGAKNLVKLDLHDCTGITDAGLVGLTKLMQVRDLELPPQTTDAGLVHVAGLTELRSLFLMDTKVTDAGLARLVPLQQLSGLYLYGVPLTDSAVPHLQALKGLKVLNLLKTKISPTARARLKEASKQLHIYEE